MNLPWAQADIEVLIPHAAPMCLLDRVLSFDAEAILCEADSHRRADHPLRGPEGVHWVHALEYGAQAAAVHGALLARAEGAAPDAGFIVSVRSLRRQGPGAWLDQGVGPLRVRARRLMGGSGGFIYEIEVSVASSCRVVGRVSVMAPGGCS